jgi:hypothetical protein
MEAITRKKEVDEMKTLAKEIGTLVVTKAGATGTLGDSGEGWEQTSAGSLIFVNHQYFDLAGLSMDDKTLFFEGATVQDTLNPAASPSVAGSLVLLTDVMSNKPITNTEAIIIGAGNGNIGAGNLTFDQTIYMRLRTFNIDLDNAAGGYMIPIADNQLGSLSPTASDRVYVTRIAVIGANSADGDYSINPCRYIIRAKAEEEAEYEYLMRLKRSYELQQEPDRD